MVGMGVPHEHGADAIECDADTGRCCCGVRRRVEQKAVIDEHAAASANWSVFPGPNATHTPAKRLWPPVCRTRS